MQKIRSTRTTPETLLGFAIIGSQKAKAMLAEMLASIMGSALSRQELVTFGGYMARLIRDHRAKASGQSQIVLFPGYNLRP